MDKVNSKFKSYSNIYKPLSPWSNPIDPFIKFQRKDLEKLLFELGWIDPKAWLAHWLKRDGVNLASYAWHPNARSDWIWGLGLPLLSDIERYLTKEEVPVLFGISGLPGCGKTSFGKWLEAAAIELNWPLNVISMDDFYLPSNQLDKAMSGNPWKVPRALPGSHSIQLMEKTIDTWKATGHLNSPQFDKALRNGLGDRCGWRNSHPKILIIEGWFLGCSPTDKNCRDVSTEDDLSEPLTSSEYEYRQVIQDSLKSYQSIWKKFKRIWHIKASKFNSTSTWKTEQEMNMQRQRGASLKGDSLNKFIRMIQTAIPQSSLQLIDADVVATINTDREIKFIGRKGNHKLY